MSAQRLIVAAEPHEHGESVKVMFGDSSVVEYPANLLAASKDLLAAAEHAQCSCSVRERDSGHVVGCWMPALIAALAKARGEE